MSRQPISFRLSEDEWLLLESNQQDGESLNQTAARLLRSKLGVLDGAIDNLETKTLYKVIDDRIESYREYVNNYVDNRVNTLITRIEALETKPKTTRRTTSKTTSKTSENEV